MFQTCFCINRKLLVHKNLTDLVWHANRRGAVQTCIILNSTTSIGLDSFLLRRNSNFDVWMTCFNMLIAVASLTKSFPALSARMWFLASVNELKRDKIVELELKLKVRWNSPCGSLMHQLDRIAYCTPHSRIDVHHDGSGDAGRRRSQ